MSVQPGGFLRVLDREAGSRPEGRGIVALVLKARAGDTQPLRESPVQDSAGSRRPSAKIWIAG